MELESGWVGNFLSTSNFDLWFFCSLLIFKDVHYLIWKIWLMSVWRMKAKAMAWLLTWFMMAQITLISYRTEAFVKTEVACTVHGRESSLLTAKKAAAALTRGLWLLTPQSTLWRPLCNKSITMTSWAQNNEAWSLKAASSPSRRRIVLALLPTPRSHL